MNILLVEDDLSIQAIAEMALTRVGGHGVRIVSDGLEALAALDQNIPDLILLDVMMPRLDGFETCRRIRSDERFKKIPIIFLTAKAQVHEMQHGMNLGAIGYILKPFDPMILHTQIDEVLSNHAKVA